MLTTVVQSGPFEMREGRTGYHPGPPLDDSGSAAPVSPGPPCSTTLAKRVIGRAYRK